MEIKNTNLKLNEGCYILTYCPPGNSYGERVTIVTYNLKETVKKYKKAGYYLFGCPLLYSENMFFALTKNFKVKTQNHKRVVIGNAMYHIQKAADNFKLQTN